MFLDGNLEIYLLVIPTLISIIGCGFIIRIDWKQYGFLFLLSSAVGGLICYLLTLIGFYTFPYRLLPNICRFPFYTILSVFPLYVLLGVRYSPQPWPWKIPFYWIMVHLGVLSEVLVENNTDLLKYLQYWDLWDSYTTWWLYFLIFEWVGGLIVSPEKRRPIDQESFRFGRLGWFILHFVLILTVLLAGFYVGRVTFY